jgi:hypothetical protein
MIEANRCIIFPTGPRARFALTPSSCSANRSIRCEWRTDHSATVRRFEHPARSSREQAQPMAGSANSVYPSMTARWREMRIRANQYE